MRKMLVVLVLVLAGGIVSWAGPLVPAQIAAEATWVGHIDIAGILALPVVKECTDRCDKESRIHKKMMEHCGKIGLDPFKDLLGFSTYSPKYGRDAGVLLFTLAKVDKEKITAFFKEKRPEHKVVPYGDHTVYTWTMRHYGKDNPAAGAFFGDTMIVLGRGEEAVKGALDVLAGKKPGLAAAAPLLKGINVNALFLGQALDVPAEYRPTTLCPVLRHCQRASLQWVEKDGKISCLYEFQTTSPETAKLFVQALDGVKAMIALRFVQADLVNRILAAVKVSVDGPVIGFTWEAAIADLKAIGAMLKQRRQPAPAK